MTTETLEVSRVCQKCHKSSLEGHLFNDKLISNGMTRVWEVWLCSDCLAPILTKKGE